MTVKELIDYLEMPSRLRSRIREAWLDYQRAEALATKTTTALTGMPGGGGSGGDDKLVNAASTKADYETLVEQLKDVQVKAAESIDQTSLNLTAKLIIFCRYVMGYTWPDIRMYLHDITGETLSCRQMYRIRNDALQIMASEVTKLG